MKTIPVKIAVSVARRSDGIWAWYAAGSSDQSEHDRLNAAGYHPKVPENLMRWVYADVPVPAVEVLAVNGQVEEVE